MKLQPSQITAFQTEILIWYEQNQRDLPWRRDRNPYHILVSEIMLQQTQVSRVIPKYEAWLQAFPDVGSLAHAQTVDVLRLWSGLGYNRRAINLKRACEIVVADYNGQFPQNIDTLLNLPGIGAYTARALACFAFDQQIAVVDTNVRKVIIKKVLSTEREEIGTKEIQAIADQLLPIGKAYEWNQALMDYASAMLKKEKIDIPKQSRFIGSNRYYRGQTIKLLIEHEQLTLAQLGELLGKDKDFLAKVTDDLARDGLIKKDRDRLTL